MNGLITIFALALLTPAQDPSAFDEESSSAGVSVQVEAVHPVDSTLIVTLWSAAGGFPESPRASSVHASRRVQIAGPAAGEDSKERMVTVVFEGVPKGRYALTALQDVDGTSSLDRDFLDRPLEPFATSAKGGAAGFAPASFEVAGETSKVIRLKEPRSVEGTFDLTVTVAPVGRQKGSVRALLWNDRGGFPIDLKGKGLVASRRVQIGQPRSGRDAEAPRKTRVTILFRAVPRGEYAVTAFHDEDDDGKVDRSFFGKPTEPVGLSNNPPRRMRMPTFQPSAVQLRRDLSIDLRLR